MNEKNLPDDIISKSLNELTELANEIIQKLEKNLNKFVLSSNQVLIWDTLEKIGQNNSISGFGKLFNSN